MNAASLGLSFSLIWPHGRKSSSAPLPLRTTEDLDLERLVAEFAVDKQRRQTVTEIFGDLCIDAGTISYRLDIIDDILANQRILRCLGDVTPVISRLRYFTWRPGNDDWTPFQEVVFRLRELEHYVMCVDMLRDAFFATGTNPPVSAGLGELARLVSHIANDQAFGKLRKELPGLLDQINRLQSITIGVNLNGGLIPYEATLLSINSRPFTDESLYTRLVGRDGRHGIAPLHSARANDSAPNPIMVPLFKDIAAIMDRTARPLAEALKAFINVNSSMFVKLQDDFLFYLGAVNLIRKVRAVGLPMCRPKVLPDGRSSFHATRIYNINLVGEESAIVTNDIQMDPECGNIVVLTGPNRGGKTTITQAIGLAQILAQAGVYVPAEELTVSLCDNVLTHYPVREQPGMHTGRFGEEAVRLKELFQSVTHDSLVLFNETFSSTSMGESLYLAQDLLRVLRAIGCRTVFTTHLHQLAADAETINMDTEGTGRVISMVSTIEMVDEDGGTGRRIRPTFRIVPGPPEGHSYAIEIARRAGITREELLADVGKRVR